MSNQPEQKITNDYILDQLQERNWNFVKNTELNRSETSDCLLESDLRNALKRINEDLGITDEEVEEVVNELKLATSSEQGIKKVLNILKYGQGVKFKEDRVVKTVKVIDYENPENNEYTVSKEVTFQGKERIRPDLVLYVNGIPLVVVEGKNPAALDFDWEDAYSDIKEYEGEVPELFKYAQIGIAADAKARYFPIVPWEDDVMTYKWKENGDDGIDKTLNLLKPERITDFIKNYLFIREQDDKTIKVMARYMQHRASEKICDRVVGNMKGETDKDKGLIWHWQGSGKTLTMIFAAHKLYFNEALENPTIFFVVDRRDLEGQMSDEVSALDLNFGVDTIGSVDELRETIKADDYRGKRGAFITLIHKFDPDQEWIPKDVLKEVQSGDRKGTIAERKNVITFLDEVQRTQYGLLSAQMRQVLGNSFYFGFTGTPISKEFRNTYKEFGYPIEDEGYLDRYFIDESQKDGFTVPIVFQPRQDKVRLPKDKLKILEEMEYDDPVGDYEEGKVKDEIARKIDNTKIIFENQNRIKKVSEDVVDHFQENVEGKFKAMMVAGSRKACALYKKEFDKYLDEDETEIVMTFNDGDEDLISDYYQNWKEKYPGETKDKKIREKIVDRFKNKYENPKILIVTNMLLTGFDAPILQTMYFDKHIKGHTLLQATARVNRTYGDVKEAGVIVDYVNVLSRAKEAIEGYYEQGENGDMKNSIQEYDVLVERFSKLMNDLKGLIGGSPNEISRDKLNEAIDKMRDKDVEERFESKYKEARKLYELLGSHQIKLKYREDYKWFSSVHSYFTKLKKDKDQEFEKQAEKYFQETVDIIKDSISVEKVEELPSFRFDKEFFQEFKKSSASKEEKVMNMVFGLEKLVLVEQENNPILQSVSDKVEKLVRKWREKVVDYEEIYDYGQEIMDELEEKESEKEDLGLSGVEYGIYMTLEENLGDGADLANLSSKLYNKIEEQVSNPGWIDHTVMHKDVLRKTKSFVRKIKVEEGLSLDEMNSLYKKLINIIEEYE